MFKFISLCKNYQYVWSRARNRGLGQGVGVKGGSRGGLKLFTSDCGRHIAVGRDGGCGGEAMMGVRVGARGWGQGGVKGGSETLHK